MRTNRFWLLAAVLLLFSCAKDETEDGGGQPVPIQLTTVGLGPATRAADGINNGNFPLETPITVAVDGSNYNYKTDATSVSNPLDCQDAIPPHFPVGGSSVHVVAYYPASVQYDTEAHPFVVAADQSTDASYAASDLMIGLPQTTFEDGSGNSLIEGTGMARKVKPTSLPIPLEFVHQLSKIKVVVTINGAAVKKVTMKNVMRSVDFKSSTGELSGVKAVATTGLDEVVMYDNTDGTSSGFTTTAIIPQQTLATGTGFIDVVVEDSPSDKTLTYKLKEAGAFVSGSQYIYNLTVSNDEIICTTSVTNWDDATVTTNTTPGDYTPGDGLAILEDNMMNPLYYVSEKDINSSANAFIASTNSGANVFYNTWANNMTTFVGNTTALTGYNSTSTKTIDGVRWVLPTLQMWLSIIPRQNNSIFTEGTSSSDVTPCKGETHGVYTAEEPCCFKVATTIRNYNSYWGSQLGSGANKTRYAIRFIGTPYCSVWKYSMEGTYPTSQSTTSNYRLVIRSKLITNTDLVSNENFGSTVDEDAMLQGLISKLEGGTFYWGESDSYVERTFYCFGYTNGGVRSVQGQRGYFASASYYGEENYYSSVRFDDGGLYMWDNHAASSIAVRLFRDN